MGMAFLLIWWDTKSLRAAFRWVIAALDEQEAIAHRRRGRP